MMKMQLAYHFYSQFKMIFSRSQKLSSVIILYVKLKFLFLVAKEHNKLDVHG